MKVGFQENKQFITAFSYIIIITENDCQPTIIKRSLELRISCIFKIKGRSQSFRGIYGFNTAKIMFCKEIFKKSQIRDAIN